MFESKFFELSFEDRELNFSSDGTAAKKIKFSTSLRWDIIKNIYDGTSLRTSERIVSQTSRLADNNDLMN